MSMLSKFKTTSKYIFFSSIVLIVLLISNMISRWMTQKYLILILVAFLICNLYVLGFEKKRFRFKNDAIINILIILLAYYFTTYLIGYFVGFVASNYSLTFKGIILNSTPILLILVLSEINRYILLRKAKGDNILIVVIFLLFTVLGISLYFHRYSFNTALNIYIFIGYSFLPNISKNILLTYLGLKVGVMPSLVYRFFMEIPMYILPFTPKFDNFINSVISLLLPVLCLVAVMCIFKFRKLEISGRSSTISKVLLGLLYCVFAASIMLSSGYFKYYIVTVATGSMMPNINIGDVIIVKKVDNIEDIKVGDVLVFEYNKVFISHRVIQIEKKNNNLNFSTKGDNNESADSHWVTPKEIRGVVKGKIPFIGYPSVWLNIKLK